MRDKGMGAGSALMILVFVVLCLAIFSLISLSGAKADQAMAAAAAEMVQAYYEADTLAETIVAEIVSSGQIPAMSNGIEIMSGWQDGADLAYFSCPVSESRELYVEIALYEDYYEVLAWRMEAGEDEEWVNIDEPLPVWTGF